MEEIARCCRPARVEPWILPFNPLTHLLKEKFRLGRWKLLPLQLCSQSEYAMDQARGVSFTFSSLYRQVRASIICPNAFLVNIIKGKVLLKMKFFAGGGEGREGDHEIPFLIHNIELLQTLSSLFLFTFYSVFKCDHFPIAFLHGSVPIGNISCSKINHHLQIGVLHVHSP